MTISGNSGTVGDQPSRLSRCSEVCRQTVGEIDGSADGLASDPVTLGHRVQSERDLRVGCLDALEIAGTADTGVVVLVPVLVGGTRVQLSHRTFLLSHPRGGSPLYVLYYSYYRPRCTHGDRHVRADWPSSRRLAMTSAPTGLWAANDPRSFQQC